LRALWAPVAVIGAVAAAGLGAVSWRYPQLLPNLSSFGFPVADVERFSARWWAYFVPPVDHALLGPWALQVFTSAGVGDALLEQQVFVSTGLLVLSVIACSIAAARWRTEPWRRPVLAFAVVAIAAAVVSVVPEPPGCSPGTLAPACWIHQAAPVFRSYARFAFLTHLGVALGAGAALLASSRAGTALAAILVTVAAFEYWPLPARARDVLPTEAHRWLAARAPAQRTLDCVPRDAADAQVAWLMNRHLSPLNDSIRSCREPDLGPRLAALGYTHVVVRRSHGGLAHSRMPPTGLVPIAEFADSRVFGITPEVPVIVTLQADGFYEIETRDGDWWRWMGPEGRWRVRNTTPGPRLAQLSVELESIAMPRTLVVSLDGVRVQTLPIQVASATYTLGPWRVPPGDHGVVFRTLEPPFRPSEHTASPDGRLLTLAFREARWVHVP
jgi:hypothetical protein